MTNTDLSLNHKHKRYLTTLKNKRQENFNKNLPFLIVSAQLPEGQVYREYPDGRIELQEVFVVGPNFRSRVVHVLKSSEADKVRREYGLF